MSTYYMRFCGVIYIGGDGAVDGGRSVEHVRRRINNWQQRQINDTTKIMSIASFASGVVDVVAGVVAGVVNGSAVRSTKSLNGSIFIYVPTFAARFAF